MKPWQTAWQTYLAHWRLLVKIGAVATLPMMVLAAAGNADSGAVAAILYLLGILLNLAMVWTVGRLSESKQPNVKQAYYQGTAGLVVYLLVTLVLTLQTLPLAAGIWVIGGGLTAVGGWIEKLLLILVGAAVSVPTLYWLPRYLLAIFPAAAGSPPLAALRHSRQVTKGRYLPVLGRLGLVFATVVALLVIPAALFGGLASATGSQLWANLLAPAAQLQVNLLAMPWALIALKQLLAELE